MGRTNTTTLTISVPGGVVSGTLLASVEVVGTAAITALAGWTFIRDDVDGASGANLHSSLYSRVANAEPASYTWTLASPIASTGAIVNYTGTDASNPIGNHSGQGNASSTSCTASSVTSVQSGTVVGFFTSSATKASITPAAAQFSRLTILSPQPTLLVADDARGPAAALCDEHARQRSGCRRGYRLLVAMRI